MEGIRLSIVPPLTPMKRSSLKNRVNNKGAKFDSFSNKITWFGHKVHLSVDTISELPIAIEVTPTHVNDGEVDPTLIGNVTDCTNFQVEFLIMDGGCNQLYEKTISFYQIEN
ncbi:hypothetical protein CX649_00060 [Bacillaceae bacterium ZC4]|uniref:hypothetical protein n=1 Tax=Aeribacillus pallidus TaxID=33936 RepID=UPI0010230DB5|nr:hypothetical protein [Aeribacillus pallidus]AXI38181.1 hypothetical protein CX649_00060 [Bacillaceae bacterium ZC4]RZI51257.1 hypothetical protein EW027_10920 [Aeribacillus pallidus]